MSPLSPQTGGIVAKHLALLVAGSLIGLVYRNPLAGLAVAALIGLAWHVYHLCRFLRWLRAPSSTPIPSGIGPWPTLFSRVHHERDIVRKLRERQRDLMRGWREVTNALPYAGFILNRSFQIMQHNGTARRMFSMKDNDVGGLHITNIIRNPAFVQLFESEQFGEPVRIVPAADPDKTYSCKVTRYGTEQYLVMVRDITKQELEDRIKADFVANASHELRTPLTVLRGYINSMVEDETFEDHWREPVIEMGDQVERMHSLVADLLSLNQLEVQLDAPFDTVKVRPLLKQACKEARHMSERKLTVTLDCPKDLILLGDKSALRSVVTNLLSNAVRFTPQDGKISVHYQSDEEGAVLSVSDTGIGIAPADMARVTERFYRTDHGRARHHGGSGIGLAIVKHALSMHQARLDIRSEQGAGTTFSCHFPSSRIGTSTSATLTPS
ncbi:MAG: phosphate regulon sensor histidine kinase PhoR [Gammaproteobacteria bacterium]